MHGCGLSHSGSMLPLAAGCNETGSLGYVRAGVAWSRTSGCLSLGLGHPNSVQLWPLNCATPATNLRRWEWPGKMASTPWLTLWRSCSEGAAPYAHIHQRILSPWQVGEVPPLAAQRFYEDCRHFPPGAYEEPGEHAQLVWVLAVAVAGVQEKPWPAPDPTVSHPFHPGHPHAPAPAIGSEVAPTAGLLKWRYGPASNVLFGNQAALIACRICSMLGMSFRKCSLPQIQDTVWQTTYHRLRACQLQRPQVFAAWRRLRGEPWMNLGDTPLLGCDRAQIFASTTGQRYASETSRGLDHLLPLVLDQKRT